MLDEKSVSKLAMAGHKIHPDRSTYTHAIYAQDTAGLSKDTEIRQNGMPVYVERLGRNLRVGDILPERLALGVNADGEVLGQNDFTERYRNYLRGFNTSRHVEYEPIPNVLSYLMKQLDPSRPPDSGKAWYVDLGFDPTRSGTPQETGEWHPDGIKMAEWKRANPQLAESLLPQPSERDIKAQTIVELYEAGDIDEAKMVERLKALYGKPPAQSSEVEVDASEHIAPDAKYETAPCGHNHKPGYFKQHARFCPDPACKQAYSEDDD